MLTLEEALEQIPGATARLPGMAAIFVELGLYGCKDVWIDQSRHPMRIQSSLGTSESEAARRGFRVKAPVTRRPPHRSGREGFPHPVPR